MEASSICFRLRVLFNLILVHILESGEVLTQNPRNGIHNIQYPHTQNTYIYLVAMYLGEILQMLARQGGKISSRQ